MILRDAVQLLVGWGSIFDVQLRQKSDGQEMSRKDKRRSARCENWQGMKLLGSLWG